MASLSRPQLTDFYTHKSCKEASSPIFTPTSSNITHHMQGLYSLMHTLHPKYPHAAAAAAAAAPLLHDHYNLNAAKPFYYGSSMHKMSNTQIAPADAEEPSFLSTHASSTVTTTSLDDQVSSLHQYTHKQAAMECKTSRTGSSQRGGELHVNAAKKRIRAVMDSKDVDKDADAKKRTKINTCEAYQRQNAEITMEAKPTIITGEKLKSVSPLKQNSLTDQKSPESKSNITKPSSSSLDQESPTKPDFIHVRARRGQATDSHSLAERVRREKISERMKYLQELVPSCIKVTGKAMMLDEIINYVQSLQRQVEFLSMKLAAVPPSRLEFSFDDLFGKKAMQPSNVDDPNTNMLGSDTAMPATFTPPTDYASNVQSGNVQSGFVNTLRSNAMFPESVQSHNVNSSIQLQTSNHEMSMACSAADHFFANLPSDLGVDDPLVHHSAAGSSSCSLVASPTDAVPDPIQQSCISQGSQLELEWDDDLHNIVQQMGCFNSHTNSAWLPSDSLLTEGFFLQGNPKEEL